jgi:hypothetical protein
MVQLHGRDMDEQVLRKRIRRMIDLDEVPCDEPEELWAGRGAGERCAVCQEPIPGTTLEYEVDVAGRSLRLHRQCYELWRQECEALSQG